MTELQYLSHQDQMDAHRRDYLRWWRQHVKPMTHPEDRPFSLHLHWLAYLTEHQLRPAV